MWATLLGIVVKSLSDSLLSTVADFIKSELQSRQLIAQGQAQQHATDLEATVKDATDAATIKDRVNAMPDSAVADDLDRLRHDAASGNL
jgi:hypothetical protein